MFCSLGLSRCAWHLLPVMDVMSRGLAKLALVLGSMCLPATLIIVWQMMTL